MYKVHAQDILGRAWCKTIPPGNVLANARSIPLEEFVEKERRPLFQAEHCGRCRILLRSEIRKQKGLTPNGEKP